MTDMLQKLRPRRTVLIRTTKKTDLPESVLYVEWLGGEMSRKVLDAEHKEHVLTDQILLSNYKISGGPEAETLIAKHWTQDQPKPQKPARAKH